MRLQCSEVCCNPAVGVIVFAMRLVLILWLHSLPFSPETSLAPVLACSYITSGNVHIRFTIETFLCSSVLQASSDYTSNADLRKVSSINTYLHLSVSFDPFFKPEDCFQFAVVAVLSSTLQGSNCISSRRSIYIFYYLPSLTQHKLQTGVMVTK